MKRYVCTVATGLLLALVSTGTATAGLPIGGQTGEQKTSFGDQTVGEQKNDADVTQAQGNGNLNIAPALGILGDAETTNAQGNGNTADANVDQSNSVDQAQSSIQTQSLDQSGTNSCCGGQSQTGTQKVYGGDQTVGEQRNDADVNQYQGNGNVNVSPAVAVFGDAETTNYQGNGNEADATVTQSNEANQSQSSTQKQYLDQSGGGCCDGQSQTGEQKTSFGDQTVGEQRNDADVNQYQGNGNVNVSPAIAIFGDAKTRNKQGNGNTASANVDQSNSVDQSQSSYQKQSLDQNGASCCGGQSQTGTQKVYGGDQTVEKQKNDADVDQWQGNGNLNISPAIAIFGDAQTRNYQGNHNTANADVTQSNSVAQSQSATQKQYLAQDGGDCCTPAYSSPKKGYAPKENHGCCDGQSQTGEQKTSFGDQFVGEQKNEADVTQKQGNGNLNIAPALAFGGHGENGSCNSTCEQPWFPHDGGASTTNYQGNGNTASADVDQSNSATQSQWTTQKQTLSQHGGGCGCKPAYKPQTKPDAWRKECSCEAPGQTGEQKVYGGDQTVEKQKNEAEVTQKQGNLNGSFAPAIAFGEHWGNSCYSTCERLWLPSGGNAETTSKQGNWNTATADVGQSNSVDQSQAAYQRQFLESSKGLVYRQ